MEISGKCVKILGEQRFVSQRTGNEFVKNGFVIETSGEYPKKVCFTVIGSEKYANMHIEVGRSYNVSFDVESREWKERWFTELTAWRADALTAENDAKEEPAKAAPAASAVVYPEDKPKQQENNDDLPF